MRRYAHLGDIVRSFDTAMLVTCSGGALHARPMTIAAFEQDAGMCFATSVDSSKVVEIERNPNVLLTLQGQNDFVSISGQAFVLDKSSLAGKLYSVAWKVWFPEGKDDPDLCFLKVDPAFAEHWDGAAAHSRFYRFQNGRAVVEHDGAANILRSAGSSA